MDPQRRFWDTFSTLKRDAIYINRYQGKVERTDRLISMFSAITSSAAIGAWAVWREYVFLWGMVIAASQVVTAIKSYLPYKARLHGLNALGPELEALALAAETDWYKVCKGLLTDEEIYQLTMTFKRKCQKATSDHFKGASLPENVQLLNLANRDAGDYMRGFISNEEADE